jgi:biopolymer transport protein TolR
VRQANGTGIHRREQNGEIMAGINITPFTDVVLVLLIIFMIATPLLVGSGITVDPPKARTSMTEQEHFIVISIDKTDAIFMDTKKASIEDIEETLKREVRRRPGIMVKINGDRLVKYRTIMKVVEATRNAGVMHYLFVAAKPQSDVSGGK